MTIYAKKEKSHLTGIQDFHHSYSQPLHSAPQQPTQGSFLQPRIAANYMVVRTLKVNFEPWSNNYINPEYRVYMSSPSNYSGPPCAFDGSRGFLGNRDGVNLIKIDSL